MEAGIPWSEAPSNADEGSSAVILIDSESEEEPQTLQENTHRRAERRNRMITSPNPNGLSTGTESVSRDSSERINSISPVGSSADYIDLEIEPVGENDEEQEDMIVYDERQSNPREAEDDELILVQEQTRLPTIQLNVPGRDPMRIRATEYDTPIRRSFERQANGRQLRHSTRSTRRQPMRWSARRANHINSQLNSYERDDTGFRASILLRNHPNRGGNHDPAFAQIQRRLESYPPDIRSAFIHAQSINEFSSIIESNDPLTWQDCRNELERLFMDYRRIMSRRAAHASQGIQGIQGRRSPPQAASRNMGFLRSLGPLGVRIGIGSGVGESLTHYLLDPSAYGYGSFNMIAGAAAFEEEMEEEARTQSILNAIQEREEQERDATTKANMQKTRQQEENLIEKCRQLPEGYSASFDTRPTTLRVEQLEDGNKQTIVVEDESAIAKFEEIAACTLCGVELGVGLPTDFTGVSAEDGELPFDELMEKYDSRCPYQSLPKVSDVDRALAKKTFVAPCGHTFCGRCVVRIENARSQSKLSKKELARLKGPFHPDNYGPKACPATLCKTNLRSARSKMIEAFF